MYCMLCRSLCDRQAVSLAVRPTETHFMRMCKNWWWQGSVSGLRDMAMFLEQLFTAGRGGDMRELELADRFPYTYPTRPYEATAILSIKQNGKTNQVRQPDGTTSKMWGSYVAHHVILGHTWVVLKVTKGLGDAGMPLGEMWVLRRGLRVC